LMLAMSQKATGYNRTVDFGLRIHVIVRETEAEARAYAKQLMSNIDDDKGTEIRERALDAKSLGVSRQATMRDLADAEGFAEANLWTGIGRARSGCGAALVGNPDQIVEKINRYVLPRINNISMPIVQSRIPQEEPLTPLAAGVRK